MPRLILIITSILALGGIALGIMNRGSFIKVRTEKDEINTAIKQAISDADGAVSEMKDVFDRSNSVEEVRDVARVDTEETTRQVNSVAIQIAEKEEGIKAAQNKIEEMRAKLAQFDGITLENVTAQMAAMEMEIEKTSEEIAGLEDIIRVAQGVVDKNKEALAGYHEAQARRDDVIALNSTEATITAVNNDWGFVIVNAGSNKGVPQDADLLIKRGTEQIGRLSIVSLEPNMMVANIIQDSLRPGVSVMPGDQVVFETDVN